MFDEFDYSFTRYLAAKKSVDDRALNRCVWDKFQETFATFDGSKSLNILEIGSGIGTMFERSIQWGVVNAARYTALDAMPENILEAKIRLPLWAKRLGYSVDNISENELRFHGSGTDTTVDLRRGDFFEFAEKSKGLEKWDVIMANAFLDLVDVERTLPIMLNLLKPNGLLFFSINFDGVTIFEPTIDRDLDSLIERLYHQTMDERIINDDVSGDSKTGRHLFEHARDNGLEIIEAGSSDWVVFAGKNGYHGDEAYFLHFIIHTMYLALKNRPEIDQDELANWILRRHSQVENLELVFMAHQIDLLCRKQTG